MLNMQGDFASNGNLSCPRSHTTSAEFGKSGADVVCDLDWSDCNIDSEFALASGGPEVHSFFPEFVPASSRLK